MFASQAPSGYSPYARLRNDEAVNAVICQPVYSDAAGGFKLAFGSSGAATAKPIGVVIDPAIRPAQTGNVLATGVVTATAAQWDAVCGTSGGLSYGTLYYLSTTVAGALTTDSTSGVAVIRGLGPTIGVIVIGGSSGGGSAVATISLTNASGVLCPAGTPGYISGAGTFDKAIATASNTTVVIGLLTADCALGAVGTFQMSDSMTLTTAQWDAITGGSGGLTFDKLYYLDVAAGKLVIETGTLPASPNFLTLVGVATSPTQLRLLIQPPIGL